jgi:hypothetical protein
MAAVGPEKVLLESKPPPSPLLGPGSTARLFIDGAAASCIAEAISLPLEVAKVLTRGQNAV